MDARAALLPGQRRQLSVGSISSLPDYYGGNWASLEGGLSDSINTSSHLAESTSEHSKLPELSEVVSRLPELPEVQKVELPPELSPECLHQPNCKHSAPAVEDNTIGQQRLLAQPEAPQSRDESLWPRWARKLGEATLPSATPSVCGSDRSTASALGFSQSDRSDQQSAVRPPTRRPARLAEWTVDHVCSWVLSTPVDPEVASRLRENAINGQVLESLSESDLESMGITKFGWRRQLLLSRQELVVRLEERLKPPEGVDFIQIHSRTVTPDEEIPGTRPRHRTNSLDDQDQPNPSSTGAVNGAGALPPALIAGSVGPRRNTFDPSIVPTPLSGAHANCVAVGTHSRGLATSPTRQQRVPVTGSGLRVPPSKVQQLSCVPLVPGAPPPPAARASMPHMATRQRVLLHSPSAPARAPTPRVDRASAVDASAAVSSALSTSAGPAEQRQPCKRVPPGRGGVTCDRGRQTLKASQSHLSGCRSTATSIEQRMSSNGPAPSRSNTPHTCATAGPPRTAPQRSPPPRTRATLAAPQPQRAQGSQPPPKARLSVPLRSLSPPRAPNYAGASKATMTSLSPRRSSVQAPPPPHSPRASMQALPQSPRSVPVLAPVAPTRSPRTSARSPSRTAGREGVQHQSLILMSHSLRFSSPAVSPCGQASTCSLKGSFTAPLAGLSTSTSSLSGSITTAAGRASSAAPPSEPAEADSDSKVVPNAVLERTIGPNAVLERT